MKKSLLVILFLCSTTLTFLSASVQAQTPLILDELGGGPRAIAMGQAFTALADEPSAAYYNPAGLAQIESPLYLTLGYQYAKPRIQVKFHEDPVQPAGLGPVKFGIEEDLSTTALFVGFASSFAEVSAFKDSPIANRFTFGLTLLAHLPEINQFRNPQTPQDPYVLKYNERWSLVAIAISTGIRITDWLSLGVGVLPRVDSYQNTPGSWISVDGVFDPNDKTGGFRMDLRQKTTLRVVLMAGILINPPLEPFKDKVSIGACFREKVGGFFGTGITGVDVFINRPGEDPIYLINDPNGRTVDYVGFSPKQISLGFTLKPVSDLTLSSEVTWKQYSSFHFFFDFLPFDGNANVPMYNNSLFDHPFNDVWVPRFGLEYKFDPGLKGKYKGRISGVSLLAGYYFEPSPVPDMNGPMNILDADQNVYSCGMGIQYDAEWTDYVKFEVFFQGHSFDVNHIRNDRDELYGPITMSGWVYQLGCALSIVY